MAMTPVRIVGSGSGANRLECKRGQRLAGSPALRHLLRGDRADPQHEDRYLVIFQSEQAEVLASHFGMGLHDVVRAQYPHEDWLQGLRKLRVVVGHRHAFVFVVGD